MYQPCPPAWVCFVWKKGRSHSTFPSRIPTTRLKRVNFSTRLWHYLANSSFSNVIVHKATKVLYSYLPNVFLMKRFLLKLLSHSGKELLKTIKVYIQEQFKDYEFKKGVGFDNYHKKYGNKVEIMHLPALPNLSRFYSYSDLFWQVNNKGIGNKSQSRDKILID